MPAALPAAPLRNPNRPLREAREGGEKHLKGAGDKMSINVRYSMELRYGHGQVGVDSSGF